MATSSTEHPDDGTDSGSDDGEVLRECSPGTLRCAEDDPSVPEACADDGSGWVAGAACSAPTAPCIEGQCVDLCAQAAETRSYMGCEYWAASLGNGRYHAEPSSIMKFALANPHEHPVTATIEGGSLAVARTVAIEPGAVETITVDAVSETAATRDSGLFPGAAFRIRTTLPVTAYQLSHAFNGAVHAASDASLLLPTPALTGNYTVLAWSDFGMLGNMYVTSGYFAIVGVQDTPTTVTVELAHQVRPGPGVTGDVAGTTQTYQLEAGDLLQIMGAGAGDVTGTRVRASAPVAVFGGHKGAQIPLGSNNPVDHIEEQLFPMEAWGDRFALGKLPGVPTYVRIVAMQPSTVTFEPEGVHAPIALDAGTFVELPQTQPMVVTSTSPIQIAQYTGAGEESSGTTYASMVLAVPVEQFRESTVFVVPDSHPTSQIMIMAPTEVHPRLDGAPVSSTPIEIAGTGFAMWVAPVGSGPHRVVTDSERIGVTVYGQYSVTAYAYPAGLDLTRLVTHVP